MSIFKKTNNAIIEDGSVPFEGSQDMSGKRIRRAGEEVNDNDYVLKKTLDDHTHNYASIPHGNEAHNPDYVYNKHSHNYTFSSSMNTTNGVQYLPDGVILQWGTTGDLDNTDNRAGFQDAIDGRLSARHFTVPITTAPNILTGFPTGILNVQCNMVVGTSNPAGGFDALEHDVWVRSWDTAAPCTWIQLSVRRTAGFWDIGEYFRLQWFIIGH